MKIRELWSSDAVTDGWAITVSVGFRYHDRFRLMFEAKRLVTSGGRDYAIDDISIPVTGCGTVPLYPESATSTATGMCLLHGLVQYTSHSYNYHAVVIANKTATPK